MAAPAAARFADVCEDDINFILENRDAKNKKLVVKSSLNNLKAYCDEKNLPFAEVEQMSPPDLCERIRHFYASLWKQKGGLCLKKSMVSIMYQL
jgi:hypothetical protein